MLKKIIVVAVFCSLFVWVGQAAFAANDATAIQSSVENLRVLMLKPDTAKLNALLAEELIYVHSDGHFNDKKSFVSDLMTGISHFTALEFKEQTVKVVGNIGIVRHVLTGDTTDKGKAPAHVNIRVMQIWQKKAGHWKLLARQSAPILAPAK